MNTLVALKPVRRTAGRPVRVASARKLVRAWVWPALRPVAVRRPALAPSAGARIETVLMGITFLALAGLAVSMEAAGVAAALL
jgi:hypothetical protein